MQQKAIELALSGKNVFITGSAGTGKSHVIKHIHQLIRSTLCSTTGIGAAIIGGSTLHNVLGIRLCNETLLKMMSDPYITKCFRSISVLIIDEISMLSLSTFETICKLAMAARKSNLPFGGIQLLVSGDFLQLPPVKDRFIFESPLWKELGFQVLELKDIIRQKNTEFIDHLQLIRKGLVNRETVDFLQRRVINAHLMAEIKSTKLHPTILFSHMEDVDRFNSLKMSKLLLTEKEHEYDCKFYSPGGGEISPKKSHAPACLQLCIGAQVILTVNKDVKKGLVNGSRGIIKDFVEGTPLVEFKNGTTRLIERHEWEVKKNSVVQYKYSQIPLLLGWALTIHRSQGMSIDMMAIDISKCFEYGQAYVALSRAKFVENLYIFKLDISKIRASPTALGFYEALNAGI